MYTAGTRNTGGTAERPGTKAKQLNIARNTCETLQNTNGIPTEYQWNTSLQRNHTIRSTTVVVFLRQNLNLKDLNFQIRFETFFIADINLFISLSLRLVYT